jgi:hypothetical protein
LDFINKKDFIITLDEEINLLEDKEVQKKLQNKLDELEKEDDIKSFLDKLEEIDIELEDIYGDSEFAYGELSFEETREFIFSELKEEANFSDSEIIKKQIEKSIKLLEKQQTEDNFYSLLEKEYIKIDELYISEYGEDYEFNFEEDKEDIISELKQELEFIEDKNLKEELIKSIEKLSKIDDEDKFFDELDNIYLNENLVNYYEENDLLVE